MKLQSSIEKILLISAVVIVAIIIFFIVLHPAIQQEFQLNKTNYVVRTQFGNIYNGKNSLFVVVHGNTILQNSVNVKVKVLFMNNSVTFLSIPYLLTASYKMPDGDNIYLLNTTKFHLNTNNTSIINVSFISGFSNNLAIMPEYQQTESVIYYPQSALQTITLYLLNTSASPSTGGTVSPQTQYYYNGSIVPISAIPNNGFGFIGWYGFGNGNYTGNNETQLITIKGNVTEIAKFGILVPIKFEENFNVPYSVGFSNYTGNQTLMLTSGLSYKYSFKSQYVNNTNKVRYILNSVTSTCGYSGNNQTINVSYADYNCIVYANYTGFAPVWIFQKSYNSYGGSGTVSPASGYYQIGKPLTLSAIPNQNSVLFEWVGTGKGSYTGNNNTYTLILQGPINETAIFGIKVPVYILSNMNGASISVGTNVYTANTVANLVLGGTYALSPKSELLNWGTKIQFTNYTGTTCKLNSNGTVTINATDCVIQENYLKEYLLLIMEQLGNNPPQNTTQYGSVSPGNYTWEPVGAVVNISAYNNVAGYSFISFYGKYGNTNYTGADSYPYEEYPNSASSRYTSASGQGTSCQETSPTFDNLAQCGEMEGTSLEPYPVSVIVSKNAHVIMNSPIIEVAKYSENNNYVRPGYYTIQVNYVYENYTRIYNNWYNQYGWGYTGYENPSVVYKGTIPITIHINESIENWSAGLGNETVYYFTTSGYEKSYFTESFGYGYYSWEFDNSYGGVANQTVKNLNYMSSYFNQIVNTVFKYAELNLSSEYKLNGNPGGIWYAASFNFANTTLYYNGDAQLVSSTTSYSYQDYPGFVSESESASTGPGFTLT